MLFVLNADGETTYASPGWCAVTGRPVTGAPAFAWQDQVHPADRDAASATLRQAIAAQAPFRMQYRLRNADDRFVWFQSGGVPSFDPATGAFTGFVGTSAPAGATEDLTAASGQVGPRGLALPHPRPPSSQTRDLVADHLASAHALLSDGGDPAMLHLVAMGLYLTGRMPDGERHKANGAPSRKRRPDFGTGREGGHPVA